MSDLTDQAKRKLCEEAGSDRTLIRVEEYLTDLCTSDEVAEKILADGKTLKGCMEKVKKAARSQAVGGMAMIEDAEVYAQVRAYYGIELTPKNEAEIIDITDLL